MTPENRSADHTNDLSNLAGAYLPGLMLMIDYLTASILVFSGKRVIIDRDRETENTMFENSFEMEQAGFVALNHSLFDSVAPNLEKIGKVADVDLLNNTFTNATVFLYFVSEVYAQKYMKRENAMRFADALSRLATECSVGRYGFSSDPLEVSETISEYLLSLRQPGLLDSFRSLIRNISYSNDGTTRYGFITGSKNQHVGCVAVVLEIASKINEAFRDCTMELQL